MTVFTVLIHKVCIQDANSRSLTRPAVGLFAEREVTAVFCAGGAVRGLLHHRSGSGPHFVEVSLQDPLVLQPLIRGHTLGRVPAVNDRHFIKVCAGFSC